MAQVMARPETATLLLGQVGPFSADALAGDAGPETRFWFTAASDAAASFGAGHFVLAPSIPNLTLRDPQLAPVCDWAEAVCAVGPGLTQVAVEAVPTFLSVLREGDLAPALSRRGRHLLIVLGRGHASPDQVRSMSACVDALAAQGVEVITLSARSMPARRRQVAEPAVGAALLDAGRAGLSFRDAAFGPAGKVAAAAGVERGRAAALQLELVDGAAAFRAAVWPGAGAAARFDRRLAARGAELRQQAASERARGTPTPPAAATTGPESPAGVAADSARPRSMLALRPDGSLESRRPRAGELVALVPVFNRDTGMASLEMMSARAADALGPVPPLRPRPTPRRPSALGALWRAVRPQR